MAKEKIPMGINLRLNKIPSNSGYGKYYPEVDRQKTLSMRGFAKHLVEHGTPFSQSSIEFMLTQMCEGLIEMMSRGVPVHLGPLGTFYPTAEVAEDAGVESIADMEELDPENLIKGIHIRFKPNASKDDDMSAPAFKQRCSFELRNIVDTEKVMVNGKEKSITTVKPIATAVAEYKAANQ